MQILDLALAFIGGMAAGAVYFAALWLTVHRFTHVRFAAVWLLASALLRIAALVGFLLWLSDGDLGRLLAAMAGFVLVRVAATWTVGLDRRGGVGVPRKPTSEASDAPDAR
jgi:F1F0 ATPase subunit 2